MNIFENVSSLDDIMKVCVCETYMYMYYTSNSVEEHTEVVNEYYSNKRLDISPMNSNTK